MFTFMDQQFEVLNNFSKSAKICFAHWNTKRLISSLKGFRTDGFIITFGYGRFSKQEACLKPKVEHASCFASNRGLQALTGYSLSSREMRTHHQQPGIRSTWLK